MRKLLFVFLICFITQQVHSQGNFYIYIQSDDNKPFYVRSGSKIFQSSGNGYLIIPDLLNDTYDLVIGFPENAGQEWKFTCSIAEKDLGFILKNNHGKGVELNGLKQERGLTGIKVENKSEKKTATVKQVTGTISEDPFSSMLADVVNDPTIKQQPTIILTARDSLNLLAKAQKKDSAVAGVAINNKLPENKMTLTGDSAKAIAKTDVPTLAGDKKLSDATIKDKKVNSTLVASTTAADSAINNKVINTKDIAKTNIPGIAADKKADEKGNTGKKVDSNTVVSATKLNDSSNNKTVAAKENKTDSTTVAAVKEKKTDSAITDTKAVAKNDPPKNNTTIIPDTKKNTDSAVVAAVIKPGITDQKATDRTTPTTINKDKKMDSLTSKAITSSSNTTPDTKAIAKNDGTKTANATLMPDNKKKTDSISSAITKPVATVTPPAETKKVVVVSSTSIKKTMQRKSLDGIELIYVDEMSDGTKETIRILIPAEKN